MEKGVKNEVPQYKINRTFYNLLKEESKKTGKPREQLKRELANILGKSVSTIEIYNRTGRKLFDFTVGQYIVLVDYFDLQRSPAKE